MAHASSATSTGCISLLVNDSNSITQECDTLVEAQQGVVGGAGPGWITSRCPAVTLLLSRALVKVIIMG